MYSETEKEKIKRFLMDKVMSDTIRKVLEDTCTKPSKDRDINILASRFLAVEVINDAWRELGNHASKAPSEIKKGGNVGL